jgi:radical S-adenosyl methionine domain-containing protein 2
MKVILDKLKDAGVEKVTFAGGEPMLHKKLNEAIFYSKEIGLTTSIITNGSLITNEWLELMQGKLDWIGLSIDSLCTDTNEDIGRVANKKAMIYSTYLRLCNTINSMGFKLKINTVVNRFNEDEKIVNFINQVKPSRWKIFDTLKVEGQNEMQFDAIKSTNFNRFVERNQHPVMVVETNELMTGSYLLIDPRGRLFENSQGKHTYSEPLQNSTMEECLKQISLNRETFIERGGIYNW